MARIVEYRGLDIGRHSLQAGAPHPYLPDCTVVAVCDDPTMGRYRVTIRYATPIFSGTVDWEPNPAYGEVARYGAYSDGEFGTTGLIRDIMGEADYGRYGELVGPKEAPWPCCVIRPLFEQWLHDKLQAKG